ncbi:unnamed protein product [Rhizoctonia solani]|uniref:Uncharacterized protein n=1 Tax=Rhizoctonia solani TaxID=456999 RepID=A0A8H3E4A4_9AGAM|nr:unnamed protein product [Rhizoctonia solani]
MRQLLLKNPDSAPLLILQPKLTHNWKVCYCSNFLRLPYELVHEGDSIQWKETGYPNIEGSSIVAHFAATSPDERARSFNNGAVFTKALCNIDPKVGMSVRGIAKELQGAINTIMAIDKKNIQHPKIYCSQKTENPHFFKALGLFAPQDSDSSVGGDSDSNA